jgi:WD40 repeat protein
MARPLELKHCLGYSGDALHYAGGSSVLHANGNTLKRLTWEGGAVSSKNFLAKGLGVGALAVHPEHTHFVMAERGQGALVSLFTQTADGDMAVAEIIEGAGTIDVDCMRFSADGALLVTVSTLPEFQVAIWDWANNTDAPIATGTAPGEVKHVGFNPGNEYQLALLGDGILYLCSVVAGTGGEMDLEFLTVPPPSPEVMYVSMVWSETGRLFATSSDGNLWNVDLQQNAVAGDCAVISGNPSVDCHLLAAQEHLICWCSDGSVAWIGLKTMVEGHRIKVPLAENVALASACLARGRYENLFLGSSSGSLYHLEVKQRMPDGSFEEDMEDPSPTNVKDVDVICGEVQSCSHHTLKRIVTSHGAQINAVCPANAGDTIASAAQDGTVMIWDPVSGNLLAAQRLHHCITSLSSHPFDSLLAMGDKAGFVYILDIGMHQRLKCRFHARLFREPIAAVSFNADGSLLAVIAQNSNQLYIVALKDKTQEVMGYMEFPLVSSFVGSVHWAGSRHVVVADARGYLLACTDIPGKEGEALKLKAVFTGRKVSKEGVGTFCSLKDQIVVAVSKGKTVKSVGAEGGGWTRVITPQDLEGLAESAPTKEWGHEKSVQALGSTGDVMAACTGDGSVHVRTAAMGASDYVKGVRVHSVWLGGGSAVAVARRSGSATVVACGGFTGSISILTDSPSALSGGRLGTGAFSVSNTITDALGEVVDADVNETTFVEKQLMADREMEIALNAAKKNTFRDSIRRQKAALDELLQRNANAPEIERIPRDQIVVDHGMRQMIIKDGDTRVLQTKEGIMQQNALKETQMARIKTLAWDSMDVHGAELRAFQTDVGVFNYPIQKISDEEKRQLKIIRVQRRMEIATASLQRKEMNQSISLIDLDNHASQDKGEAAPAEGAAAEGDGNKGELNEDEREEAWRKQQHDPLLYHRFEVTTRERKTTQLILTEHVVRKIKGEFNSKFEDFLKKKGQSLGRIDEKMARLLEINKELKSTEPVDKPAFSDSEEPKKVLLVQDSEIQVEKWVSSAEIRAKEEEERRQREAAKGDDTAERALNQMMGGSLAGESAVGKLDQTMVKPAHLILAEGEEHSEEGVKELKEWEAQYKVFLADQEAYARALDSEAKKLKADMAEECKKFDDSLQELAGQRMETDYLVYELELYKIKLMQAIAQEEDDVLVQRSLKHALEELDARKTAALQALDDYQHEVQGVEFEVQGTRDEGAVLERQFVKEVVNGINVNNKELGDQVLRAYKKRSEMHELRDHGLAEDELERAHEHLREAREHDARLEEQQAHLESMNMELQQLEAAKQSVQQVHILKSTRFRTLCSKYSRTLGR